jgi:hypothetical protein
MGMSGGGLDAVRHFRYTTNMPASNPRVNVVLEKPLFAALKRMAERDGVSLSTKLRDLVRDALEDYEDSVLLRIAEERSKTFDRKKALTHEQVWK